MLNCQNEPFITPEMFGAVGDGSNSDTKAINDALAASAFYGVKLIARQGAVYQCDIAGTKNVTNPAGGVIVVSYCVQVPPKALADFTGATLRKKSQTDAVLLCNQNMVAPGLDTFDLRNVICDGGGFPNATVPLVWFWGCTKTNFFNIVAQNCSWTSQQYAALLDCDLDQIISRNVVNGSGVGMGGNTSDQCKNIRVGTIVGENIVGNGGFNMQGNSVLIGCSASSIKRLYGRNCSGGNKITAYNNDVIVEESYFDGTVYANEINNNTTNSGTKIQGDTPANLVNDTGAVNALAAAQGAGAPVVNQYLGLTIGHTNTIAGVTLNLNATGAAPVLMNGEPVPIGYLQQGLNYQFQFDGANWLIVPSQGAAYRVQLGIVHSKNCTGAGLFLEYNVDCQICEYVGYTNGQSGSDPDVWLGQVSGLQIGTIRSKMSGQTGVIVRGNANSYDIGSIDVSETGNITVGSGKYGLFVSGGFGTVGSLTASDARAAPTMNFGLSSANLPAGCSLDIDRARININGSGWPLDMRNSNVRIKSCRFGQGGSPMFGEISPTAGATQTDFSNGNIQCNTFVGGGDQEQFVRLSALNGAARALIAAGTAYVTQPASGILRLFTPNTVTGAEKFLYEFTGYGYKTDAAA